MKLPSFMGLSISWTAFVLLVGAVIALALSVGWALSDLAQWVAGVRG